MEYPKYISGSSIGELNTVLEKILRKLTEGNVQFLFGAGMSSGSYPTGGQLLDKIIKHTFPMYYKEVIKNLGNYPFEAVIEGCEKSKVGLANRGALTKFLNSIYNKDEEIPKSYDAFEKIFNLRAPYRILDAIYTTNFDLLFEKCLSTLTETVDLNNFGILRKVKEHNKVPIIHIHGIIKDDHSYKITESDLITILTNDLMEELKRAIKTSEIFVFVGYSMNDPDLRIAYSNLRQELDFRNKNNLDTYIVMPIETEDNYNFSKEIWIARSIGLIPLNAEEFFSKMLDINNDKLVDEQIEFIKQEYKYTVGFEEFIKGMMNITGFNRLQAIDFLYSAKKNRN